MSLHSSERDFKMCHSETKELKREKSGLHTKVDSLSQQVDEYMEKVDKCSDDLMEQRTVREAKH